MMSKPPQHKPREDAAAKPAARAASEYSQEQ